MNYYPRYPGHYVAKTLHLTMEQDGAYTRLLDWVYLNERPIPHAARYTIARAMTASERRSVDAVLAEFFTREGEDWNNGRASDEIEAAQPKIAAARANGRKGGRPKGSGKKPKENPVGFQKETQAEPSAKAPQSPIPSNPSDSSSGIEDPKASDTHRARVTPAGEACRAMRDAGLRDTSPQHPELLDLIERGATPAQFGHAAAVAATKGKGFAYALGVLKGQLADAAKRDPTLNPQRGHALAAAWASQEDTP